MHIVKMHSMGVDFLLTEFESNIDYSKVSKKILDRIFGVGAKNLIVIKKSPLEMKIYDSDGKMINFDSNALSCFARYVFEKKYVKNHKFSLLTGKGLCEVEVISEIPFKCNVILGAPLFNNKMVYITDSIDSFGREILIDNTYIETYSLYIGEAHTVIFLDSMNSNLLNKAKEISEYRIFNKKINVSFAYKSDKDTFMIRTYDAANGFLHSSAQGCASVAVAARKLGYIKNKCKCILDYGTIEVTFDKKDIVSVVLESNYIYDMDYNYKEEI